MVGGVFLSRPRPWMGCSAWSEWVRYWSVYCEHNGIPLSAHFMYLNSGPLLAWRWLENSRNMSQC
jgi:hypothetical protein